MQKPVKYFKVTQSFKPGVHYGIDLGWSKDNGGKNQPLYAVENGKVISVQVQKTGGNVLHIRHNGLVSEYGHCDKILVKKGDDVVKGQHVANMGRSGIVTGNHCHFGLYKGTSIDYSKRSGFVDPAPYLTEEYKEPNENNYVKGNYKTLDAMNVRTGAGTNYSQKKVKDLTKDGQKNATSTNPNAAAVYKKGTVFTAQEIIYKNGVWAKTPSGYVCIEGASGKVYCKKI